MNSPAIKLNRKVQLVLVATPWMLAVAGLCLAQLTRLHLHLPVDWNSLPLYFAIPASLWLVTYPLVLSLATRFDIRTGIRPLIFHILVSVALGLALRLTALVLDFAIQSSMGWMHGPFENFLSNVQFLILTSLWEQVFIYWLIVGGATWFGRKHQAEISPSQLHIMDVEGDLEIPLDVITYAEAFGNYVKIHTTEHAHCVRSTLSAIRSKLGHGDFRQVHRSFIVNEKFVERITPEGDRTYVLVVGGDVVKSSRQYAAEVRKIAGQINPATRHK